MDKQVFHNILNTLDNLRRKNRGIGDSITTLEILIKEENYNLKKVGSSGVVLFGSNKSLAKKFIKNVK